MGLMTELHNSTQIFTRREDGSLDVSTDNQRHPELDARSGAEQQWKDEVDVNNIVGRWLKTGQLQQELRSNGVYADLSQITDYRESLHKVMDANAAFMALPAEVRLRFHNDPHELLQFLNNPRNEDEGIKLGLLEPKKDKTDHIPAKSAQNRDSNADKANMPDLSDPSVMARVKEFLTKKDSTTPKAE